MTCGIDNTFILITDTRPRIRYAGVTDMSSEDIIGKKERKKKEQSYIHEI